jgi:hypothetical protein
MAIESLFGVSPEEIVFARQKEARQEQLLRNQQIAQQGQQFGVFAPLYQAGLRFGDIAGQAVTQGLFPSTVDPLLKKAVDMQNILSKYQGQDFGSSSVLGQIAGDLAASGYAREATSLADDIARIKREERLLAPRSQLKEVGGNLLQVSPEGQVTQLYSAPPKEEPKPRFSNPAEAALYQTFLKEASGDESVASKKFFEFKSSLREREARAGVQPSGEVKIGDISTAQSVVDRYIKVPKEKLDTARDARTQLNLAKQGEGAALSQLQRQLVKLVGDSQIGQGEVRDALGSSGIVGDTISAVNKFMTGVPTQDKLNSVEQVINALENINARSYNQGRQQAISVIGEANFSEKTKKTLIPPAYQTSRERSLTGVDKEALNWARANPTDPRSTAILNRLGVQ